MSGQPEEFDLGKVVVTEIPAGTLQPPAIIVKTGDKLKLRSYFHCGGGAFVRSGVTGAMVGATVLYFFDDLEAGGTPVTITGGAVSAPLTAADKDFAFGTSATAGPTAGVGYKDLEGSGLNSTDDIYLSIDTAEITTGSAAGSNLSIPSPRTSGTWRVLTHIAGTGSAQVTAFDDNLVVHVQS